MASITAACLAAVHAQHIRSTFFEFTQLNFTYRYIRKRRRLSANTAWISTRTPCFWSRDRNATVFVVISRLLLTAFSSSRSTAKVLYSSDWRTGLYWCKTITSILRTILRPAAQHLLLANRHASMNAMKSGQDLYRTPTGADDIQYELVRISVHSGQQTNVMP